MNHVGDTSSVRKNVLLSDETKIKLFAKCWVWWKPNIARNPEYTIPPNLNIVVAASCCGGASSAGKISQHRLPIFPFTFTHLLQPFLFIICNFTTFIPFTPSPSPFLHHSSLLPLLILVLLSCVAEWKFTPNNPA
ncbi:hypothetical protein AMECASPLE_031324 [Ameca splendens]|uniref:Uncharacterized protein n=1 Tax=Ameca splendens TaxID=208324 RepID=A0ABV0YHD9_9TELE